MAVKRIKLSSLKPASSSNTAQVLAHASKHADGKIRAGARRAHADSSFAISMAYRGAPRNTAAQRAAHEASKKEAAAKTKTANAYDKYTEAKSIMKKRGIANAGMKPASIPKLSPKPATPSDRASRMRTDAIRAGQADFLGRPSDSFRKTWEAQNSGGPGPKKKPIAAVRGERAVSKERKVTLDTQKMNKEIAKSNPLFASQQRAAASKQNKERQAYVDRQSPQSAKLPLTPIRTDSGTAAMGNINRARSPISDSALAEKAKAFEAALASKKTSGVPAPAAKKGKAYITVEGTGPDAKVVEHPNKKTAMGYGKSLQRQGRSVFAHSVEDAAKHGLDPRTAGQKAEAKAVQSTLETGGRAMKLIRGGKSVREMAAASQANYGQAQREAREMRDRAQGKGPDKAAIAAGDAIKAAAKVREMAARSQQKPVPAAKKPSGTLKQLGDLAGRRKAPKNLTYSSALPTAKLHSRRMLHAASIGQSDEVGGHRKQMHKQMRAAGVGQKIEGVGKKAPVAAPHALQRGKRGGSFYISNGKKVYTKK